MATNICWLRVRQLKCFVAAATIVFLFGGAAIHAQDTPQTDVADASESVASPDNKLAWNRTDKYVPPDFESYFPENDEAAAKRLDEFMRSPQLRQNAPDEFIDVVRRGLRSTKQHKTSVLRMLGNTFIWGKKPQNEKAIELMYHASGAEDNGIVHYAMYFGPTVVVDRSDNLMRMMMTNHNRFDGEIQRRLNWSFKTHGDQLKTADQLEKLLDEYPAIGELTTIAMYEYYKNLMGKNPPSADRFAALGKWAIGFSHQDVLANQRDGFQQLHDMLGQHLDIRDENILEYVGRIDGRKWVGVALVSGMAQKDAIVTQVKDSEGFSIEFADRVDERLFQTRRLREFAKHWKGETPGAKPTYTLPDIDVKYTWNRDDKYVSPSFESYFPDDEDAGRRLDDLIASQNNLELSDRDILDAFRQGLKRSTTSANQKFSFLSTALGWPSDPYQTEIMFHAAALDAPRDTQYYAIYYGLGTWWEKSDNVLRLFAEIFAQPIEPGEHRGMHGRMMWSVRNKESEKSVLAEYLIEELEKHAELDDSTLVRLVQTYKQLAGENPANLDKFEKRGLLIIVWRRSGAKSEDKFKNYFDELRRDSAKDEKKVGLYARQEQGKWYGVAVVGGFEAHESILTALLKDDKNTLDVAMPWPNPWNLEKGLPGAAELDELYNRRK